MEGGRTAGPAAGSGPRRSPLPRGGYLDGGPIGLATLATELGVSRATAYRWVGDNDHLLAAVLRDRARELWVTHLDQHREEAGRTGWSR